MLDEQIVLVIGTTVLTHLNHLHLRQSRVPLHHVLGPQRHQAADLQLAPVGQKSSGEPAAAQPRGRIAPAPSTLAQPGSRQHKHRTSGPNQARPGSAGNPRQGVTPGSPGPRTRVTCLSPQATSHLPVVGGPGEKTKGVCVIGTGHSREAEDSGGQPLTWVAGMEGGTAPEWPRRPGVNRRPPWASTHHPF